MIIIYFSVVLVLSLFCIYLTIKLIDKWQLKRLAKKYPEGSVNKSVKVGSFEDIPSEQLKPAISTELIDKLKN